MVAPLKNVRDHLSGTRDATISSLVKFPDLNPQQIMTDKAIDRRAREAGAKCQPAPDAVSVDEAEHEVIDFIERQGRSSQHQYHAQLDLYDLRIQDASISDEAFIRIQADGDHALAAFKAQAVEDHSTLSSPKRELTEMEGEYSDFRRVHGLTKRLPIILPSKKLLEERFLILVLFLVETGFNGNFFAQGSTSGLIGGIFEAGVLSFFNMGLAALQGRGALRYARHRSLWWKVPAIVCVPLLFAVAVVLNLGIAHYRDLYVQSEGQVGMWDAAERMWASPLGLRDFSSGMLMIFGVFLHVIAVLKFFRMSDPYPGYTEKGIRRQDKEDKYLYAKIACIERLTDHKEISINAMKAEIDKVARHRNDYELATTGRERLHRDYVAHLDHLQRMTKRLIESYRKANREARPTSCALPPWFNDPPSVNLPSIGDLAPVPSRAAASHRRTIDTMSRYITQVNDEYAATVERFKMIDDISTPAATRADA